MHNELCACGERRKGRALASSKASSKASSNASKAPLQVVRGGKGARSPCLCTLRDFLKRFATVEMGVSGRDALTGRHADVC
jgi:hypothetical protein